jgi:hypothetical protein
VGEAFIDPTVKVFVVSGGQPQHVASKSLRRVAEERGVSFERAVAAIEQGHLMDVVAHPNQDRYPGQSIYVLEIDGYIYLVPFVIGEDGERFLKTIIPSRKATREYLEGES